MKENTSDWTPLDSGSSESKEGLEYFDINMKKILWTLVVSETFFKYQLVSKSKT